MRLLLLVSIFATFAAAHAHPVERVKGVVANFNETKGYGAIEILEGEFRGREIFVHISQVQRSGLDTIREGECLELEVGQDARTKYTYAKHLDLLDWSACH